MVGASLFGIIAGVCVAIQIALNNVLGKSVPNLWVTLVSHLGGAVFAVILILVTGILGARPVLSHFSQLGSAPWYSFVGGIFGVTIVACVVTSVRTLPIGTTLAMIVAGEFIAGFVMEQAGVLGLQAHPVSLIRVAGIAMVCLGTYFIKQV